ncbi:MAG: hypothetical protein M1828_004040 [Chrysothrix sp. TS-e1954]|nr:MAG: hypothetical protein M1828_004040 [Chrysothrix sp. TS-e1954]
MRFNKSDKRQHPRNRLQIAMALELCSVAQDTAMQVMMAFSGVAQYQAAPLEQLAYPTLLVEYPSATPTRAAAQDASPSCVTITNEAMNQHIMYCAPSGGDITSSYQGVSQDLSTASPPMTSTTSSASSTSATSSNSSSTTANTSSNTSSQTSSATAASAQQPQPTSTSHSSVSGGEIAGIVIGCLAALGLAIFLILFAIRRRRRSNAAHQANKSGPSSSPSTSEKPPLQYTQGPFEAPGHAADFTGLAAPNATPRANDDRTSIMTTWPHATQMTNTMPTHSSKAVNMLGVSEKDGTAISATAPKNPANNTISPQSNQTTWPSPPSGYDASSSGRPSPPSNTNSNILTSGPFQNTPPQGCIPSWSELPPSQSQRTSMNNHPPTSVRGQNTPSTSMYAPYRTSAELQPPTPRFENLRGGHTSQTSADGGLFGAAFGNTAGHASYLSAEDALAHGYSEGGQATGKEQTRGHGASTNF